MSNRFSVCVAATLAVISSVQSTARPQEPYDREKATSYARQWALTRNSAYTDYSALPNDGGDCTNFVSQSLRAGGWRNTTVGSATSDLYWYYVNSSQVSQTWSTAHGFYRHMNGGYESWFGWRGFSSVNYGDVVSIDFQGDGRIDHTVIVTGFAKNTDGTVDPLISYHSSDVLNLRVSEFLTRVSSSCGAKCSGMKVYRWGAMNFCEVPTKFFKPGTNTKL
jgi:hypothetical protein